MRSLKKILLFSFFSLLVFLCYSGKSDALSATFQLGRYWNHRNGIPTWLDFKAFYGKLNDIVTTLEDVVQLIEEENKRLLHIVKQSKPAGMRDSASLVEMENKEGGDVERQHKPPNQIEKKNLIHIPEGLVDMPESLVDRQSNSPGESSDLSTLDLLIYISEMLPSIIKSHMLQPTDSDSDVIEMRFLLAKVGEMLEKKNNDHYITQEQKVNEEKESKGVSSPDIEESHLPPPPGMCNYEMPPHSFRKTSVASLEIPSVTVNRRGYDRRVDILKKKTYRTLFDFVIFVVARAKSLHNELGKFFKKDIFRFKGHIFSARILEPMSDLLRPLLFGTALFPFYNKYRVIPLTFYYEQKNLILDGFDIIYTNRNALKTQGKSKMVPNFQHRLPQAFAHSLLSAKVDLEFSFSKRTTLFYISAYESSLSHFKYYIMSNIKDGFLLKPQRLYEGKGPILFKYFVPLSSFVIYLRKDDAQIAFVTKMKKNDKIIYIVDRILGSREKVSNLSILARIFVHCFMNGGGYRLFSWINLRLMRFLKGAISHLLCIEPLYYDSIDEVLQIVNNPNTKTEHVPESLQRLVGITISN